MGGPIYEMEEPVTFELDTKAKEQKLNEFLDWVCNDYGEGMWQFFKDNYDGILENKLTAPYEDFPKGMKLSKVLMKRFGLAAEDVRQKLSMLIQSNKVTGKFCLSVHPLDFLSASESNHSWRSCHALDGEYRAGNISYMVDGVTIMAYLKSDNPTILPRFPDDVPWNDKKWRCYFYLDNENHIIYASRQYPFHSDTALDVMAELLTKFYFFDTDWKHEIEQFVADYHWMGAELPKKVPFIHRCLKADTEINGVHWQFANTKVVVGDEDSLRIVPLKNFVTTHNDALCYNDLLDSHSYAPYILTYRGTSGHYMPTRVDNKMVLGAPFTCLRCNRSLPADSDTFWCHHCLNEIWPEEAYRYEDSEDAED